MASFCDQGSATSSHDTVMSRVFDANSASTTLDAPVSPLSDYPDNLSDCSEARAEHQATHAPFQSLLEAPHTPTVTSTARHIPEAQAKTAGHLTELPTPPRTLTRTLRFSQRPSSQASLPSPMPERAKRVQDVDISLTSKRARGHNTTHRALPSTPRRSARIKRPPTRRNPPPPAPKKAPRTASLVVRLRLKSRDLAGVAGNQTKVFSNAPDRKGPTKRTLHCPATDEATGQTLSSEEPARRRPRLEILPGASPLTPQFFSGPHSQHETADISQHLGQQYDQASVYRPDSMQWTPKLPNHRTQGAPYLGHFLSPQTLPPLQFPQPLQSRPLQAPLHIPQPAPRPQFQAIISEHLQQNVPSPPETIHWANSSSATVDDVELYSITQALLADRFSSIKPSPTSQPEVWAETRMELCETLHYYRSYKAAGHAKDGFAYAFMFANNAHRRDYTDANVVISRGGGGLEHNQKTGQMEMKEDQVELSSTASLRNNMEQFNPVVILTARKNPCMPSDPPHEFCVLDYFKPTHIWSEKTDGKTFQRVRFEKLNSEKPSWWQPKGTTEVAKLGSLASPVVQTCAFCGTDSQQVYLQGWMCLQGKCKAFFKLSLDFGELIEPMEDSLVYDPRFLKQRTPWPNDGHYYPLTSDTAQLSSHALAGEDCARAHWSGLVCPKCGRCCPRLSWLGWECPTRNCAFTKEAPHTLIPALSMRETWFPLTSSYMSTRDWHSTLVNSSVSFAHNFRIHRYIIPGIKGFVTHMIANKTIVEEPSGPDAMFEELQRVDIGLRRRPMGKGYHTRHFTVNYGMPYKFIAATASASFEGAASPITDTRSRLNWAAKLVLAQYQQKTIEQVSDEWKAKEFNEVLALGYLEQQRINYHDDGEEGLGPTIATLSLGAPGIMKIRMKAKHYNGVSNSGIITEAPPIPGCLHYQERLARQPDLEDLKLRDKQAYKLQSRQVPKELGLKPKKEAKDALVMVLGHGDIVIMHGADLQKYYEHSVEHKGKLRFALTCRYIDPGSLKPDQKPTYDVAPDLGDYHGSKLPSPIALSDLSI